MAAESDWHDISSDLDETQLDQSDAKCDKAIFSIVSSAHMHAPKTKKTTLMLSAIT
jgi:hypothetical protein